MVKSFSHQKNQADIKFIDLFAGIGGLRIPFEKLGGECVFSCEIDPSCRQTYQANFGEIPFNDIRLLDISKLPKFDLLLAGFPCQPFSIAGKKKGLSDERGNLFFEIVRILEYHQPKVFLLENVKGLIHKNNQKILNIMLENLENCGYQVSYQILNAKDFGLPQNRERIYIVGNKKGNKFEFPTPTFAETKLGDILEKEVNGKYTLTNRLWEYTQERKKIHQQKGNGFGYSLFNSNSHYTSTLSARYYKDGAEILVEQKNNIPRRLTPRECARLMGFSDNFEIVVSDTSAYKQFGNSVAIKVIEKLAKKIIQKYFTSTIKTKSPKIKLIPTITSNSKPNYVSTELSR